MSSCEPRTDTLRSLTVYDVVLSTAPAFAQCRESIASIVKLVPAHEYWKVSVPPHVDALPLNQRRAHPWCCPFMATLGLFGWRSSNSGTKRGLGSSRTRCILQRYAISWVQASFCQKNGPHKYSTVSRLGFNFPSSVLSARALRLTRLVSRLSSVRPEYTDRLMLSTEEYLHSLVSMINELSRLAVNSVTLGTSLPTPPISAHFQHRI